jgi:hypothetical protein
MDLKNQLNQEFNKRSCTTEWLDDETDVGWTYNTPTFIEDEKTCEVLGLKTAEDIVNDIFSFEIPSEMKHFVLMLRQIDVFNNEPIYMLYYNYHPNEEDIANHPYVQYMLKLDVPEREKAFLLAGSKELELLVPDVEEYRKLRSDFEQKFPELVEQCKHIQGGC